MKFYIENKDDREALALVLVKNGYTVKIDKEKKAGSSKYNYYVEIVGGN